MDPLKLLIYVDESRASRRAVQLVAPLVELGAAEAVLLTNDGDLDESQRVLDDAAKLLPPGAQRRVRTGRLEGALIAEAREREVDLVVIAPPKRAVWRRWLRERQAASLARHLPTSMLLVRGRPVSATLERALIAAGGGETVLESARMTARLLAPLGGEATVCHVVSQLPMLYGLSAAHQHLEQFFLNMRTPEVDNLEKAVSILNGAGVEARLKLRVGVVIDEVLGELRDGNYTLLVIGAHHAASMLDRLLLEDLSADLLLNSPVPVLLVR